MQSVKQLKIFSKNKDLYNPLVSVIIPLYNSEKYISETIKSVISQSYNNWEIIIVNDGSTDNSLCIAQSFKSEKVKIISVNNGGASKARNIGFENSSGDYIQYLDADDILDINKIQYQIMSIQTYGDDFLYSGTRGTIHNDLKVLNQNYPLYSDFTVENYFKYYFHYFGVFFPPMSWLISRKLVAGSTGWDETLTFNDDGEFFSRLILSSNGIKYVHNSVSFYRVDSINSLSKRKNKISYLSYLDSAKKFEINLREKKWINQGKEFSAKMYSKVFCDIYSLDKDISDECELAISRLGFKRIFPIGGKYFIVLSNLFGVKATIQLYNIKQKLTDLIFSKL